MSIKSNLFKNLKLIVIKIGTKTLISPTGEVYHKNFSILAKQICEIKKQGYQIIIVTSGSIGMGMSIWNYTKRPTILEKKQACAALGQGELIHHYHKVFSKYHQKIAQILLSAEDFKNKQHCINIKNTLNVLLKENIIPIINENDTVSTEEIKVGDNDKLSADVSIFLNVDLLIMLSDEEGLYTKNPKKHLDAKLISVIPKITKEISSQAQGAGSTNSVGGMRSKIKAIHQANQANILVSLINLKNKNLINLFKGKNIGTLFLPDTKKMKQKKKWLGFISNAKGQITVDRGALDAIQNKNSSLLLTGVLHCKGNFKVKDFIEILSQKNEIIARGQTSYSSVEILHFLKNSPTKKEYSKTIVQRDYLVVY